MKSNNWDAACLQETWRLDDEDLYINGYRIYLQGSSTKPNNRGRVMGGIAIILSPFFDHTRKAVNTENIKLPAPFDGRFLAIPLTSSTKILSPT